MMDSSNDTDDDDRNEKIHHHNSLEEDNNEEWNDICRVCLGPDEEGFALHKPCICAGSIAFVHQKCLEATIAEKRTNKCPVCKYTFKFQPLYAANAPQTLPPREFITTFTSRVFIRYIPFGSRLLLCVLAWLLALPLFTSYLYLSWMEGPRTVFGRIIADGVEYGNDGNDGNDHYHRVRHAHAVSMLSSDVISGIMITATIMITFLALLSLVEHFRFHWRPPRLVRRQLLQQQLLQKQQQQAENEHRQQLEQLQQNLRQEKQHGQVIDDEFSRSLRNVGFEYNEKTVHGFDVTSGDGNTDETATETETEDKVHNNVNQLIGTYNSNDNNDNNDETIAATTNQNIMKRKSIGIMDEGTTIFSDEIANYNNNNNNNNNSHYNEYDKEEDEDQNDAIESSHRALFTSSRLQSSFYSIDDDDDDDLFNSMNEMKMDDDYDNNCHNDDHVHTNEHEQNDNLKSDVDFMHVLVAKELDNGVVYTGKAISVDDEGEEELWTIRYDNHNNYDCDNDNDDNDEMKGIMSRSELLSAMGLYRNMYDHKAMDDENDRQDEQQGHTPLVQVGIEYNNKREEVGDEEDDEVNNKNDADAQFEEMMRLQEEADFEEDDDDDDDDGINIGNGNDFLFNRDNADGNNPNPLLEPALANPDLMDGEMNMRIDELIGFRGPISALMTNLMWFLAFNTTYLGVFACIPKFMGNLTYLQYSQSILITKLVTFFFEQILMLPYVPFTLEEEISVTYFERVVLFPYIHHKRKPPSYANLETVTKVLHDEIENRNSILNISDVAKMILGYLSFASSIFIIRGVMRYYKKRKKNNDNPNNSDGRHIIPDDDDEELNILFTEKLDDYLECICAVAKVSILILIKMLLFPFLIGIWLDIATLGLYKSCLRDRVIYAGEDVVGFFLLHWAVGITFMLSVTISVLQFREVLHPDILARTVKPQEGQTDMIAYLLQDDGWTHAKRFVPSLAIYVSLLALHVWLPAIIASQFGLDKYIPLFHPKLWYALSKQLQIPVELIIFHLIMNTMVEKYKNLIGEAQHAFLLKMCNLLGLKDNLLPQTIAKFKLLATIPLRNQSAQPALSDLVSNNEVYKVDFVDPFWEMVVTLNENDGPTEEFINACLQEMNINCEEKFMVIKDKGEEIDPFHSYIALPIFEKSKLNSHAATFAKKLVPPKIGSYRFRKHMKPNIQDIHIQIWQEVRGEAVPRPPAGWDYMGDNGGAIEQGRWAWGDEKMSDIENSIAQRKHLFPRVFKNGGILPIWKSRNFWACLFPVILRIMTLSVLSWATVSLCVYVVLLMPIAIGRMLYQLLGVPDIYVHDPFLFLIGGTMVYPIIISLLGYCCNNEHEANERNTFRKLHLYLSIPFRKILILIQAGALWLLLAPIMVGISYKQYFLEDTMIASSALDFKYIAHAWIIGLLLLHIGLCLHYFGAFRRGFLGRIGQFAFNNDNENNQNINNNNNNVVGPVGEQKDVENATDEDSICLAIKSLLAVGIDQEFDKINRTVFVYETTLPLTVKLFGIFIAPFAVVFGNNISTEIQWLSRIFMYRIITTVFVCFALMFTCRHSIHAWFRTVHTKIRDQRYLLGQVLLNREP